MNNFIQRLFIICRHLLNNTLLQKAHTYFAKSTLLVLATMLNGFVFASEEADDNEDIPVIEVESDTLIEEEIETWKKKQQDGKKQKKARKAKKEARKAKKKARKKNKNAVKGSLDIVREGKEGVMVTLKGIESALVKKLLASQCLETDAYTMCAKDNDASIELMIKMRSKKIVVNYETRFWASSSSIFLSKNLDFNVDFTSSTTTYDEEDKTLIIFIPAKGVAPQEREAVVPEPEEENNNNEVLVQKIKEVAKEVVKDFSHKMCITKAEEGVYVHLYDDMEGVEVLYSQKSSCLVLKKKGSFFTQKRLIIAIVDGDIVSEYSHGIGCIRKHDTLDSLLDLSQAEVSFSKETKHLQIFIPTSTE